MRVRRYIALTPLALAFVLVQCGGDGGGGDNDDDTTGPSNSQCSGSGSAVAFCKQVDHYEAGYGVAGQDVITVSCLRGPAGATVSNTRDGTYTCGGTYKLTTYATAEISLNWGGSTSFSERQTATVSRGTGSFTVRITKTSGGAGNMFLSMASGSNWMFDTVLINTGCASVTAAQDSDREAPVADDTAESAGNSSITTMRIGRVYAGDGQRASGRASAH